MKKVVIILNMVLCLLISPLLAYAQPLGEPDSTVVTKATNAKSLRPTNALSLNPAFELGSTLKQSTSSSSSGTSTFAQLAPTTRMSFAELVGDNGNYNAVAKFPAKGTYKLVVDLYHQVVLAYSKDSNGNYTVPVRYMVCTTGGSMTPTPVGTYGAKDSRRRFSQFSTGEYAQYWTKVVGEIYFHSLLYSRANANYYMESSYKLLGSRGSHGCIRLLVPDARWVYYHVAPGTTIQIRAGSASDTATANIKKQLTRAALPKTRPNCNGVGNTDVWSISGLNAQLK